MGHRCRGQGLALTELSTAPLNTTGHTHAAPTPGHTQPCTLHRQSDTTACEVRRVGRAGLNDLAMFTDLEGMGPEHKPNSVLFRSLLPGVIPHFQLPLWHLPNPAHVPPSQALAAGGPARGRRAAFQLEDRPQDTAGSLCSQTLQTPRPLVQQTTHRALHMLQDRSLARGPWPLGRGFT